MVLQIILIPRIDKIPWFHGTPPAEARRREFDRHQCAQYIYGLNSENMPELCKKFYNSIGAYIFQGAFGKLYIYLALFQCLDQIKKSLSQIS